MSWRRGHVISCSKGVKTVTELCSHDAKCYFALRQSTSFQLLTKSLFPPESDNVLTRPWGRVGAPLAPPASFTASPGESQQNGQRREMRR